MSRIYYTITLEESEALAIKDISLKTGMSMVDVMRSLINKSLGYELCPVKNPKDTLAVVRWLCDVEERLNKLEGK